MRNYHFKNQKKPIRNHTKGFSMIDLVVSVALFALVVTLAVGTIVTIISANRKARAYETVISNLNFALDSMARDLRMASYDPVTKKSYDCDGSATVFSDCAINTTGGTSITFPARDGSTVTYSVSGGRIVKTVGGNAPIPLTSSDVVIDELKFYVSGTQPPDDQEQPRVLIVVRGYARPSSATDTRFNIQTTVSQREYDRVPIEYID